MFIHYSRQTYYSSVILVQQHVGNLTKVELNATTIAKQCQTHAQVVRVRYM